MSEDAGVSTAPNRVWASWNIGPKFGPGMQFFVGGDTYAEFLANLSQVVGTAGGDLFEDEWNKHITNTMPGKALTPDEAIKNLRNGGLVGEEPQHGEERSCKHGKRQKRTGTKNGKQWTGWFCPLDKNHEDNCGPEFAK